MQGTQAKQEKKQNIIRAAAKVFARKGYKGTIMSDIAKEADLGKGTLYEYFSSKEELFFGVFEWFTGEIAAKAEQELSRRNVSFIRQLESFCVTVVDLGKDGEEMVGLSLEFWAASASSKNRDAFKQAFQDMYAVFRQRLAGFIQRGIAAGEFRQGVDRESIATCLVGCLDGILLQMWFDPNFDGTRHVRIFVRSLLTGLAPPQPDKKQDAQ